MLVLYVLLYVLYYVYSVWADSMSHGMSTGQSLQLKQRFLGTNLLYYWNEGDPYLQDVAFILVKDAFEYCRN